MERSDRKSSSLLAVCLLAGLLLAGCSIQSAEDNSASQGASHVAADKLALSTRSPDQWHLLALYGNWDFVEPAEWRAIVMQPDCDRATALAIFWMASPEYYIEFADRAAVPAVNRDGYDLINLIRERWQANAYTRAELAFDPDADIWPVDLPDLRRRFGDRVDRLMPTAMRIKLEGRRLSPDGFRFPGGLRSD